MSQPDAERWRFAPADRLMLALLDERNALKQENEGLRQERAALQRVAHAAAAVLERFDLDAKRMIGTEPGEADNEEVRELRALLAETSPQEPAA